MPTWGSGQKQRYLTFSAHQRSAHRRSSRLHSWFSPSCRSWYSSSGWVDRFFQEWVDFLISAPHELWLDWGSCCAWESIWRTSPLRLCLPSSPFSSTPESERCSLSTCSSGWRSSPADLFVLPSVPLPCAHVHGWSASSLPTVGSVHRVEGSGAPRRFPRPCRAPDPRPPRVHVGKAEVILSQKVSPAGFSSASRLCERWWHSADSCANF